MIAKLLTLSRMLRESVPFGVALSDTECARSDAALMLTRLADALSAASAARSSARCALDYARSEGNGSVAEMATWGKATNALAAARSCADDGLRAAAALLVAA